jgi:hypothetical protein
MQSRTIAGLLLALLLAATPVLAHAQGEEQAQEGSTAYTALVGAGAGVCTLVYAPVKIAYAIVGSVLSGLAWAWTAGDTDVSGPIFRAAVRGDYVVTPSHLEGRRTLQFVGPQN